MSDRIHSVSVGHDDFDIVARIGADGLVRYLVKSDQAAPIEVSREDALVIAAILAARCADDCACRLDVIDDKLVEMAGRR